MCRIIIDLCYNHNGDFSQAKEMIDQAADLKLYGIKLQMWDIDSFPDDIKNKKREPENSYGATYYEHRKHLELPQEQYQTLVRYAQRNGLKAGISAKDIKSLYKAMDIKPDFIKIPSQRLMNADMAEILKQERSNYIIHASTGMHTEEEIKKTPFYFTDVLYYCISKYPCEMHDISLQHFLKAGFYNGYSSHEINGTACKYFAAAGARYIERHYTLDKNGKGTDHKLSSDYAEIRRIQEEIADAVSIQGKPEKELSREEINNRNWYARY
jgi:N-acetylneuraminate synthase